MRYDEKSGEITISVSEAVSLSLAKSQSEAAADRAASHLFTREWEEGSCPSLAFEEAELRFRMIFDARVDDTGVLCLSRKTEGDPHRLGRAAIARLRGECFLSALAYMEAEKTDSVTVRATLVSEHTEESAVREETITRANALAFFEKVRTALPLSGREEIDRAVRRLPTLRALRFPYPALRESQREMVREAYRAIAHGRRAYIEAPTGTGKTAGALYPALRALGEGKIERVFYLTPKTTTAKAAADALTRFSEAGGLMRAVVLSAKERGCPEGLLCRKAKGTCRRSRAGGEREEEAAAYLLSLDRVPVTYTEIREAADKYGVCPYELSLRYSLFCDVIVGDYNYLFDTRVYLQRYFDRAGEYCFLIDEAHDLFDRAKEMYSATLTEQMFSTLAAFCDGKEPLSELGANARVAADCFASRVEAALSDGQRHTDKNGVLHRFACEKEMPDALFAMGELLAADGLALASKRGMVREWIKPLQELCYPLRDAATRARLYDRHYECFYIGEGDVLSVRTVCLDPSAEIARRLSLGRAAILFSATLSPLGYYRTVLGGGREGVELSLSSPFDEDRLCIAIMDKGNTRYLGRAESADAIAEAIYGMAAAKLGNYFVFCPSYEYMSTLHAAFSAAHPEIDTLLQKKNASLSERDAFLSRFTEEPERTLVGFAVTGGVFAEGIDLVGTRLIGAAVVGVSLPQPSPERDAMAAYYDDLYEAGREYAYTYPGMNRVLQAAGRVIRTESDRGVLLLIDDRFADPFYRGMLPPHWRGMRLAGDGHAVQVLFSRFWEKK